MTLSALSGGEKKISSLKESEKKGLIFPLVTVYKSKPWDTCEIAVIYQTLEDNNEHHPRSLAAGYEAQIIQERHLEILMQSRVKIYSALGWR